PVRCAVLNPTPARLSHLPSLPQLRPAFVQQRRVYLPDFPSMMMFVRDHAAAFSVETANSYQYEMLQIMQKFFQAVHGHDALNICKECDPHEWQRQKDRLGKK
ncbi:hypothetical protein, partial [Comamonas aquatica]|uniref:hypothetical protein n=1 Tax=Comamonas aquatica TaxID=225991 RepID=UPI003CFE74A7